MRTRSVASATCAVLTLAALAPASSSSSLRVSARLVSAEGSFVSTAAGSWTATASMSTPRSSLTATRLGNGRVLVVGGADVAIAEQYDPPTRTWIPAGTLNEPRGLHVALRLADGRVLVAGGGRYSAGAEL